MSKHAVKPELLRYLTVGLLAVVIDAASYSSLIEFDLCSPNDAKKYSFMLGAFWAFFANKLFTFKQNKIKVGEPVAFAVVYLIGFLTNSFCHDLVLYWLSSKSLSFLFATGVSTSVNFLGQKYVVFRKAT